MRARVGALNPNVGVFIVVRRISVVTRPCQTAEAALDKEGAPRT